MQIRSHILSEFPYHMTSYHEPFVGGGAILIEMARREYAPIHANDINESLINAYIQIRDNCDELTDNIASMRTYYNSLGNTDEKKEFYYDLRRKYNNNSGDDICEKSAQFIFLNKTCFRGLYRVDKKGNFNVPFGNYSEVNKSNESNIELLSRQYLCDVNFSCMDYTDFLQDLSDESFIYMDPPYCPLNSQSFTSYQSGGFSQQKLRNFCHGLSCRWLMSNSYCDWINNNYNDFNISTILCKRSINSKTPNEKKYEVIIKNYD